MRNRSEKSLDEMLAELPRSAEPLRDLWPGIADRLQVEARRAPDHRPRPIVWATAAAVMGACVASLLTWAVLHGRHAIDGHQLALGAADIGELKDPHYLASRASLQQTFNERLMLLEPATRSKIVSSLAVIQRAHEEIEKALASDPASPVLEQLWQSTWHDELDLYDHVVRATQPTMTRT